MLIQYLLENIELIAELNPKYLFMGVDSFGGPILPRWTVHLEENDAFRPSSPSPMTTKPPSMA